MGKTTNHRAGNSPKRCRHHEQKSASEEDSTTDITPMLAVKALKRLDDEASRRDIEKYVKHHYYVDEDDLKEMLPKALNFAVKYKQVTYFKEDKVYEYRPGHLDALESMSRAWKKKMEDKAEHRSCCRGRNGTGGPAKKGVKHGRVDRKDSHAGKKITGTKKNDVQKRCGKNESKGGLKKQRVGADRDKGGNHGARTRAMPEEGTRKRKRDDDGFKGRTRTTRGNRQKKVLTLYRPQSSLSSCSSASSRVSVPSLVELQELPDVNATDNNLEDLPAWSSQEVCVSSSTFSLSASEVSTVYFSRSSIDIMEYDTPLNNEPVLGKLMVTWTLKYEDAVSTKDISRRKIKFPARIRPTMSALLRSRSEPCIVDEKYPREVPNYPNRRWQ